MDDFLKKTYRLNELAFDKDIPDDKIVKLAWVDREVEIEKIFDLVKKSKQNKKNSIFVLIGDHGMGKTSTLKKVFLESKGKEIFPIFINLRSPQRIKNPGPDLIFKIFKNAKFSELKVTFKDIDAIDCHNDVKNLFKAVLFENEFQDLALSYIKGEIKLSQKELHKIGIIRKLEDFDILKEYLETFLIILKRSGFSTLLVAFDEFEYLFSMVAPKDRSIYLALFREIYDMPSFNNAFNEGRSAIIVTIWAISQAGWQRFDELSSGKAKNQSAEPASAALLRRIKNNRVLLNPFNKELTENLIKKRLSMARISEGPKASPLIPYTSDFVDFIYKQTGGRLDLILLYCEIALEAGLLKQIKEINSEFAKQAIKEKGYSLSAPGAQNKLFEEF
jgi:hypothetical protein